MKIVSSVEMQRIEQESFREGYCSAAFMDKAAEEIVSVIKYFIEKHGLSKKVLILAGKGNNGGDGYTVGTLLCLEGFHVEAFSPLPLQSPSLCFERYCQFVKSGGKILTSLEDVNAALIIDALLGTGYRGDISQEYCATIEWANQSNLPILSIDIPSGLCGSTGIADVAAICATETLFLGCPKIGFFVNQGPDYMGKLHQIDFGLPLHFVDQAQPLAHWIEAKDIRLPPIHRSRHKYLAGYLIGVAGLSMEGAAILSTKAALRSGCGLVRLFSGKIEGLAPEVIQQEYDEVIFEAEAKKARAFFVGPGIGRTSDAEKIVKTFLNRSRVVFDADALYFLAKHRDWKIPDQAILTPHKGEMALLLEGKEPNIDNCQAYANHRQVIIILKGFPTIIFCPGALPWICTEGDPGMATAGSGDVLTGIVASFLAQGLAPLQAAITGTYLHGLAGSLAAQKLTSYGLMASDLIAYLPEAIAQVLSHQKSSL